MYTHLEIQSKRLLQTNNLHAISICLWSSLQTICPQKVNSILTSLVIMRRCFLLSGLSFARIYIENLQIVRIRQIDRIAVFEIYRTFVLKHTVPSKEVSRTHIIFIQYMISHVYPIFGTEIQRKLSLRNHEKF